MNVFDRKYCIVDNTGNYYSINEYDALVAVKDQTTAQWFDILEANRRITSSGMSNMLRTVKADKKMMKKKDATKPVHIENLQLDEEVELSIDDIDLQQLAQELQYLQLNLPAHQTKLRKQQTAVDEEICDLLHFIELYQMDDDKSLELVARIRDCRQKRREIKDELYREETFSKLFSSGGMNNLLKDVSRQIENMEVREYAPRQIPQLFVGAEKLSDLQEDEMVLADTCEQEELIEMEYERRDTIFDGKENDWVSMVNQQKDFFENAQQYIANLQMDVEDLDAQIEDAVWQCENSNCNVTQGYKLFKQIKDLRLTRTAKIEELNKVGLIAGCFDCNAMADTYRYCVDSITGIDEESVDGGKSQAVGMEVINENTESDDVEIREAV